MSEANLPDGWNIKKLGNKEVAITKSGGTPNRNKSEYFGGDILWVKSGELNDNRIYETEEKLTSLGLQNSSAKVFPPKTLLVALYGATAGKTAVLEVEATTNQAVCAVFPQNESFDCSFLQHQFIYIRPKLLNARSGGAQPNISQTVLSSLDIVLPPLPEQRAIARALRAVQEAKAARQKELALERERKAALMQHLFTYGTRGEARKQTEIGEMPESWGIVKLGEVARIVSGGTPERDTPEYWNGDISWVKTGEINYSTILKTEESITKEGLDNSSARVIQTGALLMAMYGQGVTRGRVAILGIDAAINQACAAILLPDDFSTEFLFFFLTFSYEKIRLLGHGANQKNLNSALIRSIIIPMPSLPEQKEIATLLTSNDKKLSALQRECEALDELFRAMLEEFMTGKLPVQPLLE
ncbi:MAG: restriction endonuclease subunit S [Acidobacteria bacterium]|nr:restriction endonuclease subunit S [Acidobacteriota bacterium]